MRRRTSTENLESTGCGYLPISDYAFVGDCHGAALVATDGSVDWCCLRRFDADPVFTRILDASKGGFFQISPEAEYETQRAYTAGTHILETSFLIDGGSAHIFDFMPVTSSAHGGPELQAGHRLVRIVRRRAWDRVAKRPVPPGARLC